MTKKDINIEDEETLNEQPVEETDKEAEENTANEEAAADTQEEEAEELTPLEKAEAENAELKDKWLRAVAEFENYRRRVMKEKAELIKNGGEKVMTAILPILDDFDRANDTLAQMGEEACAEKKGVELIIEKFEKILKQQGLEKMDVLGKPFDVDFHEAVAMVPGQPDELKGKVIDCVQAGYILNEKVIRHAKVAVAQ